MRYSGSLVKKEREQIFELFLNHEKLKFNEIEKAVNVKSNMAAYHIEKMIEEGLLGKKGLYYYLTKKGEQYIPIFEHIIGEELSPTPVVLVSIVKDDKILLIKRNKRPYKDYWSMIGGKIKLDETFEKTSLRLVKNKTNLNGEFKSINAVFHEQVTEEQTIKHSFILFFTKVEVQNEEFKESKAGKLQWFKIEEIKEKEIIPSDYWLIKNKLNSKVKIESAEMKEKNGKISELRFKD
ncbi:MAG: NUDIX domain-containing protein [Nanoarchaeota archaeon]|nr:NUDIX domain-containing protein [Nanoarchaeota archaeon]MBU1854913.1 NUDIX domain-containing protein [Nanoarchaeota archaeon]